MVIESFQDSYHNLTLKTTFLLKWLSHRCPRAKFILKVDDDVFINTENLWTAIQTTKLMSARKGPREGRRKNINRTQEWKRIYNVAPSFIFLHI